MYVQRVIYGRLLTDHETANNEFGRQGSTKLIHAVLLPFKYGVLVPIAVIYITADGVAHMASAGYTMSKDAMSKQITASRQRRLLRRQISARIRGNADDNIDFPSDLFDLRSRGLVELIDRHNKPHSALGLLDTGALIGALVDKARISPKLKRRTQPDGLIDSETAEKLQLLRSPYRGKALKGFSATPGCYGAVPKEQITVTWRFGSMKIWCKSVLAIHDPLNFNCIIGINGIKRSKIWQNNPDVVNILPNTGKDETQSEIPRNIGKNPLDTSGLENPFPTSISSIFDSPDSYPSSELSSDSSEHCGRALLDRHPGHLLPNFALSCLESDLESDNSSNEQLLKLLDRDREILRDDPLF